MKLLSSGEHSDIISWSSDGHSFDIKNPSLLVSKVLPLYFKETKYSSFVRKLCRWGFVRTNPNNYRNKKKNNSSSFFHELFRRDDPFLCSQIVCAKNSGIDSLEQNEIHQQLEMQPQGPAQRVLQQQGQQQQLRQQNHPHILQRRLQTLQQQQNQQLLQQQQLQHRNSIIEARFRNEIEQLTAITDDGRLSNSSSRVYNINSHGQINNPTLTITASVPLQRNSLFLNSLRQEQQQNQPLQYASRIPQSIMTSSRLSLQQFMDAGNLTADQRLLAGTSRRGGSAAGLLSGQSSAVSNTIAAADLALTASRAQVNNMSSQIRNADDYIIWDMLNGG